MAQRPKAKPKRKSQKGTDKEQSARFVQTARELEAVDRLAFEQTFEKIVVPRQKQTKQ